MRKHLLCYYWPTAANRKYSVSDSSLCTSSSKSVSNSMGSVSFCLWDVLTRSENFNTGSNKVWEQFRNEYHIPVCNIPHQSWFGWFIEFNESCFGLNYWIWGCRSHKRIFFTKIYSNEINKMCWSCRNT